MKKILVKPVVFALIGLFAGVPVKAENTVTGTWATVADEGPDKGKVKSHVEIYEKDGAYFGKAVELMLKPQDLLCEKCAGILKNKPIVGMIFLRDMKSSGKRDKDFGDGYAGGTIMDPDNGKTYKCKLWVKGDVLTVRGYIGFFYRTQRWLRVK